MRLGFDDFTVSSPAACRRFGAASGSRSRRCHCRWPAHGREYPPRAPWQYCLMEVLSSIFIPLAEE